MKPNENKAFSSAGLSQVSLSGKCPAHHTSSSLSIWHCKPSSCSLITERTDHRNSHGYQMLQHSCFIRTYCTSAPNHYLESALSMTVASPIGTHLLSQMVIFSSVVKQAAMGYIYPIHTVSLSTLQFPFSLSNFHANASPLVEGKCLPSVQGVYLDLDIDRHGKLTYCCYNGEV